MRLRVVPLETTTKSVISYLFVDGKFQCYILEPPNPIPAGVYDVKLEHSVKFQRIMPVLQNVPGHTAIEIHWGNTAADTKDCLIVGKMHGPDFVGESVDAFNELFPLLQASTSLITIDVERAATSLLQKPEVPLKGEIKVADPTPAPAPAPTPATIVPAGALDIHPKVVVYTLVIVIVNTLIATAKAHGWADLTADATTLSTSLGALAAYYTQGA